MVAAPKSYLIKQQCSVCEIRVEYRFFAGSYSAHDASEICDGENL